MEGIPKTPGGPRVRTRMAAVPGRESKRALPRHAREHNRSLVTWLLYGSGPMSRAAIARKTGLAKVTVSELIAELIEAGYVEELGMQAAKGPGKPAILVDLARDAHRILAVDLSDHRHFRGALLDLDANLIERISVERNHEEGQEALDLAFELIARLISASRRPVLGIGIGTPGIVDAEGRVVVAQNLIFNNLQMRALIEERFGLPTVVGNDATMAAIGQQIYGESSDNFVLVTVGHGIGAGVIVDGRLVRGSSDSAGEIGIVVVGTEDGADAPYRWENTLEYWLTLPSLERRLKGADDSERIAVLKQAGERLGLALAPIVAALDISQVVLIGTPLEIGIPIAEQARLVVLRRVLPGTHQEFSVTVSERGYDLILLGCTAQVLRAVFGYVGSANPLPVTSAAYQTP